PSSRGLPIRQGRPPHLVKPYLTVSRYGREVRRPGKIPCGQEPERNGEYYDRHGKIGRALQPCHGCQGDGEQNEWDKQQAVIEVGVKGKHLAVYQHPPDER